MIKFLLRWKYKIPKYMYGVWYNQSAYMSDRKYPIIFDEKGGYINADIGRSIIMGKTRDNRDIYYKIVRINYTPGSDWLFESDAINCDLKFDHLS